MQRKKNHGVLLGYQYPQKLVNWREKITQRIPIEPEQDPLEPFMEVTEDALAVRDSLHNLRLPYLVPLVIALWFIVFNVVGDIKPNSASIITAQKRVVYYTNKQARGEYFNDFHQKTYNYYNAWFDSDGDFSIFSYGIAIFKYGSDIDRKFFITDLVVSGVSLSLAILFSFVLFKMPRPADIYFDRKRGIVYTWSSGRIGACRFENLGFLEHRTGLHLYLYWEKGGGQVGYCTEATVIQPTGKITLNREKDNDYFLAQIFNYMDKGRSAIITEAEFFRERPMTYFRLDKRPERFEERLEKILELEEELPLMYGRIQIPN
ncbi:hypothetical protein [Vibrio neptunius]|uniref:hypothetical protein n=1 Tax=Vibrio neptunius TaxID=170651 RepID=UPI0019D19F3B|nr:hypothetical protein [Vibrio neptunius]MBN3573026.1 hypothetical protein [Vibrio neptunius]QXX08159.1 hypothetical protein KW548_21100 [Vibrio neptunius]